MFFQTLGNFIQYSGRIPKDAVGLIHELANAELTLELSVHDILWGYEDAYLKLFQDFLGEGTIPSTQFGIFLGVSHMLIDIKSGNYTSPRLQLVTNPNIDKLKKRLTISRHPVLPNWENEWKVSRIS